MTSDYRKEKTLYGLFKERLKKTPDKTAVVCMNESLTFRQLDDKASRLAGRLLERGLKPGAPVGILVRPSSHMVVGMLGVLKAGGAFILIDPANPGKRLLSMVGDNGIIITDKHVFRHYSHKGLCGAADSPKEQVQLTDSRPPIRDLDNLPVLNRTYIDYGKYLHHKGWASVKNHISLLGSRGCAYNCIYCHKIWKKYVCRSPENIFDEIRLYYDMGVRRFLFLDGLFNFNVKGTTSLLEKIIKNNIKVQIYFPAGLRGDILTKEYINLLIAAGTVNFPLALETASPRLQKIIRKNLNIEKLRDNLEYICEKHPEVCIELYTMHGFPTETEEEAMMTLDFIKSIRWLHFPYINILRIFPNTEMEKFALESGISQEAIDRSMDLGYHELPETLPFPKNFTLQYRSDFVNNYFLSKERLLQVLPHQMKIYTEDELVYKYATYLQINAKNYGELFRFFGIDEKELPPSETCDNDVFTVTDLNNKMENVLHTKQKSGSPLKILLLDLSFSFETDRNIFTGTIVEPMGLLSLQSYLDRQYGDKVFGKIAVSMVDFFDYNELYAITQDFKPDLIGIRVITYFKDFFHRVVEKIRQWNMFVPIVTGGPYATCDYKTLLKDRNVDIAVIGEGEITFGDIVGKMLDEGIVAGKGYLLPVEEELKAIKGIAYLPGRVDLNRLLAGEIIPLDNERGGENLDVVPEAEYPRENVSCIEFVSGDRGRPAGIMLSEEALINLCSWHNGVYNLSENDRTAVYPGYNNLPGLIFPCLLAGATLYFMEDSLTYDIKGINDFFVNNGISICYLPVHIADEFLLLGNKTLRHLLTDSGKITHSMTGDCNLSFQYGCEECTFVSGISVSGPNGGCTVSLPVDNTRFHIIDEKGNLVPEGETGELGISGKGLAMGYWNSPEGNGGKFIDNPDSCDMGKRIFRTGDKALMRPDGTVELSGGRIDDRLKIKGYRIEAAEIEMKLAERPDIEKAAVMVEKNMNTGVDCLCAYLTGDVKADTSLLKEYLSYELPWYMIPEKFVFLDNMPLTKSGATDKAALAINNEDNGEDWIL
ncbi:MAG: AMP-binding protein [Spirochaetales bacterium]|nr:AMP-binding protein [Spirochaetales bacterium]